MIVYPPPSSMSASRVKGRGRAARRGPTRYRQTVQWRQTNVEEGVVLVDRHQLSSLIKNEPIENYYQLDPQPFATGMFASVRKCRNRESGEVFAAKFSRRKRYGEDATREIHHEIALLSLCSPSPRIVTLHDLFQTPEEFIIVMEYAPGGDMQTIIDDNVVPYERDVVKFVRDVVEALVYLHHRKIAHLDIKPQNLVMMGKFPDCDIKVCDFEISRVILDGTEIHEVLGTPEYVAPEILHYEPITLAADMWSLGVTTYVLLTGFSPFGGETDQETFLNISRAQVDFPDELFEDVSEEARDFIKKLLVRKPSGRMSAKECLKHPWLAQNRKSGCGKGDSNLSKYLSKSREALFERLVSRHTLMEKDLRKSTLLRRYDKTRRMCESQMSLVSKARQRAEERALTRSREKLYGLKSLSRSHEVLHLYKSLANLRQEVEGEVREEPREADPEVETKAEVKEVEKTEDMKEEETEVKIPEEVSNGDGGLKEKSPHSPTDSLDGITTSESEVSEEDGSRGEEEEPRYTVAQLISAYNMHQELVTKSSLEVTMNSPEPGQNRRFPTGPNALRLFIPDLHISSRPKRMGKRRSGEKSVEESDSTPTSEPQTPDSISGTACGINPAATVEAVAEGGEKTRNMSKTPEVTGTVAKTVELFDGALRPQRKSFSTPRTPPDPRPTRRKSSSPTMKSPI